MNGSNQTDQQPEVPQTREQQEIEAARPSDAFKSSAAARLGNIARARGMEPPETSAAAAQPEAAKPEAPATEAENSYGQYNYEGSAEQAAAGINRGSIAQGLRERAGLPPVAAEPVQANETVETPPAPAAPSENAAETPVAETPQPEKKRGFFGRIGNYFGRRKAKAGVAVATATALAATSPLAMKAGEQRQVQDLKPEVGTTTTHTGHEPTKEQAEGTETTMQFTPDQLRVEPGETFPQMLAKLGVGTDVADRMLKDQAYMEGLRQRYNLVYAIDPANNNWGLNMMEGGVPAAVANAIFEDARKMSQPQMANQAGTYQLPNMGNTIHVAGPTNTPDKP